MRKIFIFSDAAVDDEFAVVVIVCVSYHPTSTNETFSCYRFAFISLSLACSSAQLLLEKFFILFISPRAHAAVERSREVSVERNFPSTRLQLPCSFSSLFFLGEFAMKKNDNESSQMPKFELLWRIFRINIQRHTCEIVGRC